MWARRSHRRIDFVRTGEISGCFTAHLAETVEDVKTIKEDNRLDSETGDSCFFSLKKERKEKSKKRLSRSTKSIA